MGKRQLRRRSRAEMIADAVLSEAGVADMLNHDEGDQGTGDGDVQISGTPPTTASEETDIQLSELRKEIDLLRQQLAVVKNVPKSDQPNIKTRLSKPNRETSHLVEVSSSSGESGSEFDFPSESADSRVIEGRRVHCSYRTIPRNSESALKCKLPNFYGKESWKIWYNRFNEVAIRHSWSDEDRLDVLLPRLQGIAGEFAYDQLSQEVRQDYLALISELNSRFRVIETSKSYQSKFNNRNQKPHESAEEFTAELKKLYVKAYPERSGEIKQQDLLRKFFEGLSDESVRFQVEYVKAPQTVDEAVYEVINLQETKRNGNVEKVMRMRQDYSDDEDEDSEDEVRIARVPANKKWNKPSDISAKVDLLEKTSKEIMSKLNELVENKQQKQEETSRAIAPANDNFENRRSCYVCQETTHFARECPNKDAYATCQLCRQRGHYATTCPSRYAHHPNA